MSQENLSSTYEPAAIEQKWQKKWLHNKTFAARDGDGRPKYYCLDMFPYPSGAGLHVGHPEGYTASDILSRYKRACGFNVLHPMGWDAFGLPAEQYAVKTGTHPRETTLKNIDTFRRQIQSLGLAYDWDREVDTTDPLYYKWTQWIFLKLFEKGLAYVDRRPVWWCEELKTVLANEEVIDGKSEVGHFPVERKYLLQWVLRITAYADRLLEGLEGLDWPDSTKRMQAAWIGRSVGAEVDFAVEGHNTQKLTVYTTRPDTLFGVTFMVIAPEHPLVEKITTPENKKAVDAYIKAAAAKSDLDRTELNKDKTGVFTGAYAINPANGRRAQIWVGDYVLGSYGTGAIIAVPAHDERDYDFAKKHGIEIVDVIANPDGTPATLPYTEAGKMVHSGNYDGMDSEEFKKRIVEDLGKSQKARATVNYKLRDWLFSRQRYWGEPFPILWLKETDYKKINPRTTKLVMPVQDVSYEEKGQTYCAVGLPYASLPLELPQVEKYQPAGDGQSPLANEKSWVNVFVNPETGEIASSAMAGFVPATRETNTMPQWAGSCWYYLRYTSPHFGGGVVDPIANAYWGVPDFYIGGAEHAVLHLLYSRFWHQFLYDIHVVKQAEPFKKLFHQGIILGEDGQKMSKSRGNVINPDDVVREYGADAFRLYEMFMGPLEDMKPWSSKGIEGVSRFLRKVFREFVGADGKVSAKLKDAPEANAETEKLLHATIKKVTTDIEGLRFNTAISAMMILMNQLQAAESVSRATAKAFVQLMAPFAPHVAEELWERLGGQGSVGEAKWPSYDEGKLVATSVKIAVQVNGKLRAELELPASAGEAEALAAAKANEKVAAHLQDKQIRKVIFVKGRLINLVVG